MPTTRSRKAHPAPVARLAILVTALASSVAPTRAAPTQGERVILDFETASFDPQHVVAVTGFPGWAPSDCAASQGSGAAWSLGAGARQAKRACDDPSPAAVQTSMILSLDLREFEAEIPQLDLILDLRMAAETPATGTATTTFSVNLLEQAGGATPSRITVYERHDSTKGLFVEQRLDLTELRDIHDPSRSPINLAGSSAFIELMYHADPVTGPEPAGVFVDHLRLAFSEASIPTETATPTPGGATPEMPSPTATNTSPRPTASPPRLFLPWLGRDEPA